MMRFGKRTVSGTLAMASLLAFCLLSVHGLAQKQTKLPGGSPAGRRGSLRAEGLPRPRPLTAVSDRLLIRFRPDVESGRAAAVLVGYALRDVREIPKAGCFRARIPEGVSLGQTLEALRANPDIVRATPDFRTRIAAVPNDTYFLSYQYNLYNHGIILHISPDIMPQTTAKADIKAMPAWDETKGNAGVVIAVLDTGVDMTHPELVNKVVSTGRDFVNGDMDATDDNGHGTLVAGIAAADTDNNEGIAGVAWNCKVLPVKVADAAGNGFYSDLIDGLIWAADNGAKVINISLGGTVDDPALQQACQYAFNKGVVIAAAAGNGPGPVDFPAAYDDFVLAVAATDYTDSVASFSNFGPQVDVAAPGVYIIGPVPQWYVGASSPPYVFASGTSASSPHVAGLAALLLSDKPWLTPQTVMNIIRYTADDVNKAAYPGKDDYIGYGRINMERALVPTVLATASGAAMSAAVRILGAARVLR